MTAERLQGLRPRRTSTPVAGRVFANPRVRARSWYVASRARHVSRSRARSETLLGRRVVLWRDDAAQPHVWDARCPHLGADLAQGRVVAGGLRCPFHHWTFDSRGACSSAPGHTTPPRRAARAYPTVERFGLIWMFNGDTPSFDLPGFPDGEAERDYRRLLTPERHIDCHPHLVIGNGLDAGHFDTLHGMEPTAEPVLEPDGPYGLSLTLRGRPRGRLSAFLSGTRHAETVARFRTRGPSIAWATVESPVRFHTLFTARPGESGGCDTQLVVFLPKEPTAAVRALVLLGNLLHADRRILDRLDFHPGFTDADEPLRRFAALVDGLGAERAQP